MSEALVPAPSGGRAEIERPGAAAVALPAVIVDAGPGAVERFLEFFAAAADAPAANRFFSARWTSRAPPQR